MFRFNNKHCSEFDMIWKSESRPFIPIAKKITESLPEMDGEYDFSDVNLDNRLHYENRIFSGIISVKSDSIMALQNQFSKIANWIMCGYAPLIFDDMPTTVWTAKIENVDQVLYALQKIGKANLTFTVKPFSKFLYDSDYEIILDSEVMIGSDFLIGGLTYDFTANGNTNITVKNYGDWYTKPIVTVTGTYGYVEIKADDTKHIRYFGGSSGNTVIFDFEKNQVSKNGAFDNIHSLGSYWDFPAGDNAIQILTNGTANLHFYMMYNFKYGAVIEC